MSRTTVTPAPARTDVAVDLVNDAHERRLAEAAATDLTFVRRMGGVLAAGAGIWSVSTFVVGSTPATAFGNTVQDLTGFLFQVGVMALLAVQARTMATGTSRVARAMIPVERVILGIAMLWSLLDAVPSLHEGAAWLPILDICWPLSMLGMFVIGIKIAVAGRWRGLARVWPLVAESWAVVTVPTFLLVGEGVANTVGGTHLLLGYGALGLLLVLRPELTRPRG
ncbi:hypothetical protein [Phycicoccus flavus]|uniref:hypothetical protein n=1 Tax=Phycicoccus flavus TaxID=2502783 RepID=UPI000FEBA519|nr:hypothetical protein [Phycicoccus flavus]NHA67982.1 hypothetical protein [Phycicoccus flavus]